MKKPLRTGFRLALVIALCATAFLEFVFRLWLFGKATIPARAAWLQKWSRRTLWIFKGKVTCRGKLPAPGILASNHLSYLDVLAYASVCPLVFLSKSEVRSWPFVGKLTRCAGTLYIQRQNKAEVLRLGEDLVPVIHAGVAVTLFLEGTSSNGEEVLPFRSSLLAPAQEHDWPVTPGWIHYHLPGGSAKTELCYWGEMTFAPHFVNALSQDGFEAFVSFGEPLPPKMDRKEMARELHRRVCQLKAAYEAGGFSPGREEKTPSAKFRSDSSPPA